MSISDKINDIIGIKESFELPDKLLEILLNKDKRIEIFNKFLEYEKDLSYDWFTDYFQNEHGDRDKLKQDYTPDCISTILEKLRPEDVNNIADICGGVGGLSIKQINSKPEGFFYLEELSGRAIPLLLFNLSIRNINAVVWHGDSLSRKVENIYRLSSQEDFSDIEIINDFQEMKFDFIISNPPYSISWDCDNLKNDIRFKDFPLAPKSKADYAFVLHCLNMLKNNGVSVIILPTGVLFRGSKEEKIREKLIELNLIDSVILLPDKLFANTGIPVCLLVLKKNKQTKDILFIDASHDFIKKPKQNNLSDEHIDKIVKTYLNRSNVDKYSRVVEVGEIINNGYNLNMPRYVDTYVKEEVPSLEVTMNEILEIEREIDKANKLLLEDMKLLRSTDSSFYEAVNIFENIVLKKG